MQKIQIAKKYTFLDKSGTIRYTDGKNKHYPVVWERDSDGTVFLFTRNGASRTDESFSLVEVMPYANIPIDTPGWVRADGGPWKRRHFAGVTPTGHPTAWDNGATSFTANGAKVDWKEFTTTKPEGV